MNGNGHSPTALNGLNHSASETTSLLPPFPGPKPSGTKPPAPKPPAPEHPADPHRTPSLPESGPPPMIPPAALPPAPKPTRPPSKPPPFSRRPPPPANLEAPPVTKKPAPTPEPPSNDLNGSSYEQEKVDVSQAKASLNQFRSKLNELEAFTTTQEIRLDELTRHYESQKLKWAEGGDLLRLTGRIPDISSFPEFADLDDAPPPSPASSALGVVAEATLGTSAPAQPNSMPLAPPTARTTPPPPPAPRPQPPPAPLPAAETPDRPRKAVVVKAPRIVGPRRSFKSNAPAPAPVPEPIVMPKAADASRHPRTAVIRNVDSADLSEVEAAARRRRASRTSATVGWIVFLASLLLAGLLAAHLVRSLRPAPPAQPVLLALPDVKQVDLHQPISLGDTELTFGAPVIGQMQVRRDASNTRTLGNTVRDYLMLPVRLENQGDLAWDTSEFFARSECVDDQRRVLPNLTLSEQSLREELNHRDKHSLSIRSGEVGDCLFAFPLEPGSREVTFTLDSASAEHALQLRIPLRR